jgi:uncharacterized protein
VKPQVRVGLVSDTHGLFDPRLPELLGGCELILHAGDVVQPAILDELSRIAPVRAVRGNNDSDRAFQGLPEVAAVEVGELRALLVHIAFARGQLLPDIRGVLARHGAHLLVHGHSHRPLVTLTDGVLLVNPGSAGPRRFRLPRSAGLLEVRGRAAEVRLFDLAAPRLAPLGPPVAASW